jgi:prevent-host-death family protein
MKKKTQEIGLAEFKAKCIELIDDVHGCKRCCIIITKRGKPYAKLVPVDSKDERFYGSLKGLATIQGDLTKPVDVEWDAFK